MADDAIGYGRPPKRTQFVKGQSGNPSGRPEGSQNLAAVLNATIRQRIKVTENGRIRYTTKFEAIIAQLVNKALRGDVNAIHELRYWIQFLEDSLQTNSQPPGHPGERRSRGGELWNDCAKQKALQHPILQVQIRARSPNECDSAAYLCRIPSSTAAGSNNLYRALIL